MHLGQTVPAGSMLNGREEKSVQEIKLRVQMRVMERLGFLQKPTSADDVEVSPMTDEQIGEAFIRWDKFRFGPRFHNLFMRMYNGYHDDATGEKVAAVQDETKLVEAITNVLREPPEIFQSRFEDTSHSGFHT